MNTLQKSANSSNSVPRNMELFLLVSLVLWPVESNMKKKDVFVELKDPDPLLCLILKKNWSVYVIAK